MRNRLASIIARPLHVAERVSEKGRALLIGAANTVMDQHSINIGGGPWFAALGWRNLEGVVSPVNSTPFGLNSECVFPVEDGTISTVYSSHVIEHLDDATVLRVFREAHRVLADDGRLVIKCPDFDLALDFWKRRDPEFFTDELWGYDAVKTTWANRGMTDSLDARAAMLFCGFWNDDYGDHFSGRIRSVKSAYHGPPVVSSEELACLTSRSPWQISCELKRIVMVSETSYHFNHQNAWSREELESLLISIGFRVNSFETAFVVNSCLDIPEISSMQHQSLYCLAAKDI